MKQIKRLLTAVMAGTIFPVMRTEGEPSGTLETRQESVTEPAPENPPITDHDERISLMEGILMERDAELKEARKKLAEMEQQNTVNSERLEKLDESFKKAVDNYREIVISANRQILPELISGESVEEIQESLAKANELTERIKAKLEEQAGTERIPAGAPQRGMEDTGNLTAREKILKGIG
jgi:lipopolysaccharide biosynthesis regulator YciM